MGFSSVNKQIVGCVVEAAAQGVFIAPAAGDAIPMIRSCKITPTSIRVDRPTLRLSLSDIADIAPGKATVDIEFEFELTANNLYAAGAGVTSAMRPIVTRVLQGVGFLFQGETALMYAYPLTSIAGTAPMRHRELLTGTTTPGSNNFLFGDTYGDDGMMFVDHGAPALAGSPFISPVTGSNTTAVVGARNVTEIFGWELHSAQPDGAGNGHRTVSMAVWKDGKLLQAKGCMGNVEFLFNHGDAIICRSTMRGVVVGYTDAALPTSPNEGHKYPPTFLGSRLTLRQTVNAPTNANKYGSDGGGSGVITGALNRMTLNTGNEVTLRENSMDPNGINYATITDRSPGGSFNPDEVLNTGFDFVSRFISGTPLRLRCAVSGPGATTPVFNDPATNNQNTFAFIASGIVFDGQADGERDNVHVIDSTFKITGGDYDTGAATELPGNDNELVIVHY